MPFTIPPFVILTVCFFAFSALMWWYHWLNLLLQQAVKESLSRVASVSKQSVKVKSFNQAVSLFNIGLLAGRQKHSQWITQPIYSDMNFGCKSTSTTTQCLRCLAAFFLVRLLRMDVLLQSSSQSFHAPCLGHLQNGQAFAPIHRHRTSAQTAYKWCSISHIVRVTSAMMHHFGSSKQWPQQIDGIPIHFCQHRHLSPSIKNLGSFSTVYHSVLRLT